MDSKITKKRLSNFFQYEWIILIVVIIASIFLMEFVYSVAGVRLTTGQQYKIYFDQGISPVGSAFYDSLKYGEKDSVLSYDVLELDTETLQSDFNVLSTRLSIQEGDMIITDKTVKEEDKEERPWNNRANILIDNVGSYHIYSLDALYKDMGEYLSKFKKNKQGNIALDNLDETIIKDAFLSRMKSDNRFRTDSEKTNGIKLEKERIKKLVNEYLYFGAALNYGKENGWFYQYTRYDYLIQNDTKNKTYYEEQQQKNGIENFGLLVGALTGGSCLPNKYFAVNGQDTLENAVLLVFDFEKEQPALQYESVCVINSLIRNCTPFQTVESFNG